MTALFQVFSNFFTFVNPMVISGVVFGINHLHNLQSLTYTSIQAYLDFSLVLHTFDSYRYL